MGKKADPTCSDHTPAPRGTSSKPCVGIYTEDVAFSYYLCIILFHRTRSVCCGAFSPVHLASSRQSSLRESVRFFSNGGSPGFADWKGRNADGIGIGPVHPLGGLLRTGHRSSAPRLVGVAEAPMIFPLF